MKEYYGWSSKKPVPSTCHAHRAALVDVVTVSGEAVGHLPHIALLAVLGSKEAGCRVHE